MQDNFLHSALALELVGEIVAFLLFVLVRLALPKPERKRTRIAGIYLLFSLAFGVVSGFALDLAPGSSFARATKFLFWFTVLAAAGRSLVLLAVDVALRRRTQTPAPRIFRDLTQAVVYVVVLLLTLNAIGVEPGSLLTTSALLTAVIGLSLQDTLGNLMSGLALQMQQPFEVGDWIQFGDDKTTGRVTEANWRATMLMTTELVEVVVPNATLARAPIRNFSRPSPLTRRSVNVLGPYDVPPHVIHEAVTAALKDTPGVLAEPAAWVRTTNLGENGVEYSVFYYIDDYGARDRCDGLVRDRIWYAMNRAKIAFPYPTRTVNLQLGSEEARRGDEERELARRNDVLRCVDFLQVLSPEHHRRLADSSSLRLFAPGEVIVKEGEKGGELFAIDRGSVNIEIQRDNGKPLKIAQLGAGQFFGEMGLMTGEPRTATVRAKTDCALVVIGHGPFHEVLREAPELVEKMSELLAARQAELEAAESQRRPSVEPASERSQRLISQIKNFFKL